MLPIHLKTMDTMEEAATKAMADTGMTGDFIDQEFVSIPRYWPTYFVNPHQVFPTSQKNVGIWVLPYCQGSLGFPKGEQVG